MLALVVQRVRAGALPWVRESIADLSLAGPGAALVQLMVGTDLLLLFVHLMHMNTAYFSDAGYSLVAERGFAGVVQALQLMWITAILLQLFVRTRSLCYLGLVALFGYLALDDWFSLHERLGHELIAMLGLVERFGLRAQDLGELIVSAAAGTMLFGLILIGFLRADRVSRRVGRTVALLIGVLVAFGVGADMLHSLAMHSWMDEALLLVEEGGEMLSLSMICAYLFTVLTSGGGERRGQRPVLADSK